MMCNVFGQCALLQECLARLGRNLNENRSVQKTAEDAIEDVSTKCDKSHTEMESPPSTPVIFNIYVYAFFLEYLW